MIEKTTETEFLEIVPKIRQTEASRYLMQLKVFLSFEKYTLCSEDGLQRLRGGQGLAATLGGQLS